MGLASHCIERLYTLGADMDRRKRMDKRREENNGHRKKISPIRDT